MRVSVVVCTTGRRLSLEATLASIRVSTDAAGCSSELLVVHNASHASTEIERLCCRAMGRYIHEPVMGLSVARNRGVIEARGDVVAFVDDDIIVAPDWAAALLHRLDLSGAEVVTGKVSASAAGTKTGAEWNALYGGGARCQEPVLFDERSNVPFFPLTAGVCGMGGNMCFRTHWLLENGLFDVHFGLGSLLGGGEEVDRFYAVLRAGGRIVYAPDVAAEHVYAEHTERLHSKIRGYAAAQAGFLLKCFLHDRAARGNVVRFVRSRAGAVLSRPRPAGLTPPAGAPARLLIAGSVLGPFAYVFSLIAETIHPRRQVSAPRPTPDARQCRVLIAFYSAGLSGAPRLSRAIARHLQASAAVHAILPSTGPTTAWLHEQGIRIGILPVQRLRATFNLLRHMGYLIRFPGILAAYRRAIRELQPDIVHVDSFLNLPALLAARLAGRPTLLHIQEVPRGIGVALARLSARLSGRVVAVSEAAALPLRSTAAGKIAVVHNGTPRQRSAGAFAGGGYVAFFGRLSEDRDPILFVRAAQLVYRHEGGTRFLLCGLTVPGRDKFETRLLRAIAESGIPPSQFLFVRDVEDTGNLLAQCSVVVSCLRDEGFGLAILEAMAAGRPVVVPRSGAFPEYITDGQTGVFYSPGKADELGHAILRLLRDSNLADSIARRARALVETRFTEEQMAAGFKREYEALLAGGRVPGR